jgi:hypothetical protein
VIEIFFIGCTFYTVQSWYFLKTLMFFILGVATSMLLKWKTLSRGECTKIILTILRTNLVQTLSQIVLNLLMVSWADVTLKIAKTLSRKKTLSKFRFKDTNSVYVHNACLHLKETVLRSRRRKELYHFVVQPKVDYQKKAQNCNSF